MPPPTRKDHRVHIVPKDRNGDCIPFLIYGILGLCLFCAALPSEETPLGNEIPVVEYHFAPHIEGLGNEKGPYKCELYFLVQDLYRRWFQNQGPAGRPRHSGCHSTCHRSRRQVRIDSGKPCKIFLLYPNYVSSSFLRC